MTAPSGSRTRSGSASACRRCDPPRAPAGRRGWPLGRSTTWSGGRRSWALLDASKASRGVVPIKRNDRTRRSRRAASRWRDRCLARCPTRQWVASPIHSGGSRAGLARCQPDLCPREPRDDPAASVGVDRVHDPAAIQPRPESTDEARLSQQPQLPARRRSTEADLGGDRRWSHGAQCKRGDDPPPGLVGQQRDPAPVSSRHSRSIRGSAHRRHIGGFPATWVRAMLEGPEWHRAMLERRASHRARHPTCPGPGAAGRSVIPERPRHP